MKLYGIPNCDTIKKAKKWLEANGLDYEFHDYRKQGVDTTWLQARCEEHGWKNVLNRRGTTWRQLDEDIKNNVDASSAITLMQEHPAMIKRPLLGPTGNNQYLLGFKADQYEAALL